MEPLHNYFRWHKICGTCGKKLPHRPLSFLLRRYTRRTGTLWTYSLPGEEQYYRYYGTNIFYCKRCFDDPNWIKREEQEREKEKVMKSALKNTKILADLQKRKEQKRAQVIVDQNMHQVQSVLQPTIPSNEALQVDIEHSRETWMTYKAPDKFNKETVSELLKGLWKYPELFSMLTLDQITSFSSALGDLLIEWGHTNPLDVPIEVFHWIHVFLVEQYLEFNQFDLSAAERSHVHEVLASMFTSVGNIRELVEVTTYVHQIIDTLPILESDESLYFGDNVAAGFIHLLLSERFSEAAVDEAASAADWPQAACMTPSSQWPQGACVALVNILIEPPQKDTYNYRQALSKLVNGKIWKPMEVVDLLLSIQTYVKSEDNNLSKALEQLIASRSESTLGASRTSVTDILNTKGTKGLLQRVSSNISTHENAEKDIEKLCKEIKENKWAKAAVLEKAKKVAQGVIRQLTVYGYPDGLVGDHFIRPLPFLQDQPILSDGQMLRDTLTLLCCAVRQCEGYWPRASQILSCSLLSTAEKGQGRLIEISTGEGKSCIIAMYAVLLALSGKTVDVVTSSPLLAERDCKEWKKFYELCGLCVSNNVVADNDSQRLGCYEANIVYGTVGSFASDILRQEFHLRQTRGSRDVKKSAVIADEVDFMLLDRGVQFTYLSDKSLGLRHLEPLLATIWTTVSQLIPIKIEGEVCFADQPKPFHQAIETAIDPTSSVSIQQILEEAEKEGVLEGFVKSIEEGKSAELLPMVDSDKMIELFEMTRRELHKGVEVYRVQEGSAPVKVISAEDESLKDDCPISVMILEKGMCLVIGKDEKCLQAGITEEIKEMTSPQSSSDDRMNMPVHIDEDKSDSIKVPVHLHEFVADRIPVWVRSAFQALLMTEDREYHIRDGQVLPVDFGSTGVIEANKKWGDGLQQFVELKHLLQISEISLVTNYMSNLAFFKRYEDKLYGVTGTLGSEIDKQFLKREFHVDLCHVPTHKKRKLYEDTGRILQNEAEWVSAITEEVMSEVKKVKWRKGARAALVICEDIISAEKVASDLHGKVPGKLYVYTGKGTNKLPDLELSPCDVVVATNLAGRGTDIKVTNEVDMAGGLFVIVSFLPSNTRVEMQAFGRTGRKGQPGSAKLIVNYEQLPQVYHGTAESVQELKMNRELAKDKLDIMMHSELHDCSAKEELFKEYCIHLKKATEKFKNLDKHDQELAIKFLHDKWGLWLQMKSDDMRGSLPNLKEELGHMVYDAVRSIYKKMSGNIYHTIHFGNNFMFHSKFKQATKCYNTAVQTDSTWASIALYNRAYCTIKLREDNYKRSSISDLEECLEKLENYKKEIQITTSSVQFFSSQEVKKDDTDNESDLLKYLVMRHQVLALFEKNVKEALGMLESLEEEEDAETYSQCLMSLPHTGKDEERELSELWMHGLVRVYSVKKKPGFCWSALAVFFIGVAQVVAGIFLTAVSSGALGMIGKTLVEEGVSDMFVGMKGMITGEFDVKAWGIGKAISLAISLVTFGVSSFIKKGVAAKKGVTVINETVGQLKAIPGMVWNQLGTGALTESVKIACTAAGKELVQQGVLVVANIAEDKVVESLMNEVEQIILSIIQDDVKQAAVSGKLAESIHFVTEKTLKDNPSTIDDADVRKQIKNLLTDTGAHIVNEYLASPEWQSYAEQLVSGVSEKLKANHNGNNIVLAFTTVIKVAGYVHGVTEAVIQTKMLRTEFESKLDNHLHEALGDGTATNSFVDYIADQSQETKDKYDKMKQDIGDDLARILSASIKDIWHKNFVGKVTSEIRKKFNGYLSTLTEKALERARTNDELMASVTALHAASMPTDVITSGNPTRDIVNNYAQMLSHGDEMAGVMEARILSEMFGKQIIILKEDENGKPLIRVGTNQADDVITVIYQKPTGDRKCGHYDAVVGGKLIRVENEGNDCLYHAVSLARGGSQENVENDSRKLKTLSARKLNENPEKWGHLITRTNQARTISPRLMMVGGAKTNVKKADVGTVFIYKDIGTRNNGEVQADHQPPGQAIKLALETNLDNALADKLRIISEGNGNRGFPAVIMWTCDHKYVVSTGHSRESKAAARYIADSIVKGDVEEMLKAGILAGSVDFAKSAYATNNKKMHTSPPGYQTQSDTAYKKQNIDLLKSWQSVLGPKVMSVRHYKRLERWVNQEQYKNMNDPTRKAFLAKCKAAKP